MSNFVPLRISENLKSAPNDMSLIIIERLKNHSNFDLARWGLSPQEAQQTIEMVDAIHEKVYGTEGRGPEKTL